MKKPGKTGAKRQSFFEKQPRELLMRLKEANPLASKEKIEAIMFDEVAEDHRYWGAVFAYWFTNNWKACEDDTDAPQPRGSGRPPQGPAPVGVGHNNGPKPSETPEEREKRLAAARKAAEEQARAAEAFMIWNLKMPNRKPLFECTKADLIQFGGFYKKLAEKVPAGKTVGQSVNPEDVQKLYHA